MSTLSQVSYKQLFLILLVLFAALLVFSKVFADWQGPTATAPGGNVAAPINVSGAAQEKLGGLLLNTATTPAPNGLIVYSGKVGLGTATPGGNLDVENSANSATICLNGNCISAWPGGGGGGGGGGISAVTTASCDFTSGRGGNPCTTSCPATYYRTGCSASVNGVSTDPVDLSVSPSGTGGCTCVDLDGAVGGTCYAYCAK